KSTGVQFALTGTDGRLDWRTGGTLEWANSDLYEYQQSPAVGSPIVVATRPVGLHYDYDVTSLMAAGYEDARWSFTNDLTLVQTMRVEWLGYDYKNHGLDGNTKDDGTPLWGIG